MSIVKRSAEARIPSTRPIRIKRGRPAVQPPPARKRLVDKARTRAVKTSRAVVPEHLRFHQMAVVPHADGWALMVEDVDEPAWVVSTKKKAIAAAKGAAKDHAAVLRIHKRSGALQRELSFA